MTQMVLLVAHLIATITPTPRHMELDDRHTFVMLPGLPVMVSAEFFEAHSDVLANVLSGFTTDYPLMTYADTGTPGPGVIAGTWPELRKFLGPDGMRPLGNAPLPPEGYRIVVGKNNILVAGGDAAGILYGLSTLNQLVSENQQVPWGTIEDYPDAPMRAVRVKGLVDEEQLDILARFRCNTVFFESHEFLALDDEALLKWQPVFRAAKRRHMEPIPVIDPLDAGNGLATHFPAAAQAREKTETFRLTDDSWQPLAENRVIEPPRWPVRVFYNGQRCIAGEDYELVPGITAAQSPPTPWIIRRVASGTIPNAALVSVQYLYVPDGPVPLCPCLDETEKAVTEAVAKMVSTLQPRSIHLGTGPLSGLYDDPRCRARFSSIAEAYEDALGRLVQACRRAAPDVRLILRPDVLAPSQLKPYMASRDFPLTLLEGLTLDIGPLSTAGVDVPFPQHELRIAEDRQQQNSLLAWIQKTGRPFILTLPDNEARAQAWYRAARSVANLPVGVVLPLADSWQTKITELASRFDSIWTAASPQLPWPRALNDYFEASLVDPDYDTIADTLAAYLNHQTLEGKDPAAEYTRFEKFLSAQPKDFEDLPDVQMVAQLFESMTEYLDIEQKFAANPGRLTLNRVKDCVQRQLELDPETDQERAGRILEIVDKMGLLVPSSILFRRPLFAARPMAIPSDSRLLEIPVEPSFVDQDHEVQATVKFAGCPGALYRLDFDTLGTATLVLMRETAPGDFATVQRITSDQKGGVMGPLLIDTPFEARAIRVLAIAPAQRAVLRTLRLCALKTPATIDISPSLGPPQMDGVVDDPTWRNLDSGQGFMVDATRRFAVAQTRFQICLTNDTLYIAARMSEPRIDTMAAQLTEHDAPLWHEEAIEILIQPPGAIPYRFLVNPHGTRYEAHGLDAAWSCAWQARTTKDDEGWTAECAIPAASIGLGSGTNQTVQANVIRHRRNVENELSAWSSGPTGPYDPSGFGEFHLRNLGR